MHNPVIFLENKRHKFLRDFKTDRSPNLGQTTRPYNNQPKKRTCRIVDLVVLADHWVKLKECEKTDKYLDLARELKKKLWKMKVTIIPIENGVLGTVTKGLVQGLGELEITGRVETVETTALLKFTRILTQVLEIWGDLIEKIHFLFISSHNHHHQMLAKKL